MTTRKHSRAQDDDCDTFVDDEIRGALGVSRETPEKKPKKPKTSANDSPSNTSAVHDGASPPTVESKLPSNPHAQGPNRSLSFSNGAPKSRIVMERLKDLCSMKEPTVNVGIEIVGAAYLLKVMTPKRPSCDDDHDEDDDMIGLALNQAVKAANLLLRADHLRNKVLQLLSMSQKLFDKDL